MIDVSGYVEETQYSVSIDRAELAWETIWNTTVETQMNR